MNNIALYSEIASDYLGPVRVSAGITLTYPKNGGDSTAQSALTKDKFVQRFGTGGGVINLNFALPIFYFASGPVTSALIFGPRIGIEPPGFGASSDAFPINGSLGTDLQLHLVTIKNVFDINADGRVAYDAGSSAFYNMLQLAGKDRKGFWLNNYTVGVIVAKKFSISYTGFWGTSVISERIKPSVAFTVDANF